MTIRVAAAGLAFLLALGSAATAAPNATENLDFSLKVESASWTSTGFMVKAVVDNRTGSPEVFLHHEPDQDDPEAFTYAPTATPNAQGKGAEARRTFTLKGLKESKTTASLVFGLGPDERAGLLVVGEARAPHRQVAIALKDLLPPRPVASARPAALRTDAVRPDAGLSDSSAPEAPRQAAMANEPLGAEPENAPPEALAPGVIRSFTPPHTSFGRQIVLKEGHAGPAGEGWVRIYTELPDVTLDQLARVLERPAQIWRGDAGWLYLRNIGGTRALAIEVRDGSVIAARYVTPQTLGQVLGPGTRFPKRVYMGRP